MSTAAAATRNEGTISTDTFCATTEARPPNSAANTWAAIKGQQALKVTWDEGPHAKLSSAAIHDQLVAALEQERGPAQRERLLDLPEDDRLGEDVPLGIAGKTIEGAEIAVGHTEVRVVDVAINDEGDLVRGRPPVAELPRRATHRDEIAGPQQSHRVVLPEAFAVEGAVEDVLRGRVRGDRRHG